jgi:hypothetical protein
MAHDGTHIFLEWRDFFPSGYDLFCFSSVRGCARKKQMVQLSATRCSCIAIL